MNRFMVLGFTFLFLVAVGAAAYWYFLPPTFAQRLARVTAEVTAQGGTIFQTELQGKPLIFLSMDCKVYILDFSTEKDVREKVLGPGFYPWFTSCNRQSISKEGEYLLVFLSNQAIGAGGGNIGGGSYRSKDGRNWEKKTDKGWLPLAEAQP